MSYFFLAALKILCFCLSRVWLQYVLVWVFLSSSYHEVVELGCCSLCLVMVVCYHQIWECFVIISSDIFSATWSLLFWDSHDICFGLLHGDPRFLSVWSFSLVLFFLFSDLVISIVLSSSSSVLLPLNCYIEFLIYWTFLLQNFLLIFL